MAFDFSSVAKTASSLMNATKRSSGTVFDLLDPANARRAISGLLPGGASGSKESPNIGFQDQAGSGAATAAGEDDWRVRLSLAEGSTIFYKDSSATSNSIMAPLIETNGVIWPYTPQVSVSHVANYNPVQLTHSNYSAQFYNNSDVADIQISGEYTVQNVEEGQYLMAVIYFLRASTKMFFGSGTNVGNPPPILFLDGYGSHYFPHVPVVVTNFTHTMPNEVDYVQVPISQTTLEEVPIAPDNSNIGQGGGLADLNQYAPQWNSTGTPGGDAKLAANNAKANATRTQFKTLTSSGRVPTNSTISVTLRPIYSRKNLHDRFNLNDFAQGKLVADKDKGFGGFL